jgi:hypothetical protein
MSSEEAKRRAELYQALADGKTLQVREIVNGGTERWCDIESYGVGLFLIENREREVVRIKPEQKKEWVRVGLWTAEGVCPRFYANALRPEESWEGNKYFGGWLTDRIEYELPEGEV